ncbi:alpha/beta fold hydrolase [Actinoplanes flavus]|uniref:Alpha/beta hydrolase n=1 Tax=Actinoplanes flavus TaxID=2820290 RepID=A0ABS3UWD4_9ACTN|nr:alpha/beta hydrolase [Actinoplanes flavus]MBO3739106.1 alpha/beta hydrolase [Actinoplanes flavus]MBO3742890.1 alpha/beta hydrolase [Actinoplanes flavus]
MKRSLAVLVPVAWGVAAALWTPRGPLTGGQALWSIVISLVVGVLAGRVAGTRWMIVGAPLAYAIAFELTRIGVTGPSVDAPHPSVLGSLVLITGRGVHGLLALFPMAAGAAWGGGVRRRIPLGLAAAGLALVTVAVAVPARTERIPGGVAELAEVDGLRVMIRGRVPAAPVLLFVPGPPGGSMIGTLRRRLPALEERFVVATLERRSGAPLTLDSEVADIVAVTEHLRGRFGRDRIVLAAHSGGSIPAVTAAHRRPGLYQAYLGIGQAVSLRDSDRILYADMLAWARSGGRDDLVERLTAQGPPPWPDVFDHEPFQLHAPEVYGIAGPPLDLGVPEYTPLGKAHVMTTMLDAWDALYPNLQDVDLRRDVPELAIPAWFVQGGREMRSLAEPFATWYAALRSPDKRLVVFPESGHHPMSEEPDRFAATVTELLSGQR